MNVCLTKEQQQEAIAKYKEQHPLTSHPVAGNDTALNLYLQFSHDEILEEIEYRESHGLKHDIDFYPLTEEWRNLGRLTDKYWFHADLDDLYLAESFYRIPNKKLKKRKNSVYIFAPCISIYHAFCVYLYSSC